MRGGLARNVSCRDLAACLTSRRPMLRRSLVVLPLAAALAPLAATAQVRTPAELATNASLTVKEIMAHGDTLRRSLPSPLGWDERGDAFYFRWNPGARFAADSLYRIRRGQTAPEAVPYAERRRGVETFGGWAHGDLAYSPDFGRKVTTRGGNVIVIDRATGAELRLAETSARASGARFAPSGRAVVSVVSCVQDRRVHSSWG